MHQQIQAMHHTSASRQHQPGIALLASLLALALSLAPGQVQAQVIATQIKSAENSLRTANQRLFISSAGALYELRQLPDNGGWQRNALQINPVDGRVPDCYFLGMAENAGMVYAVCAENIYQPNGARYLYAFDSRANGTPQANAIATLPGVAFPNGLAADGKGSLYLADSGAVLLPGSLRKLVLQNDGRLVSLSTLHQFPLCKPNGVKLDGTRLYVSVNPVSYVGESQLLRYELSASGLLNKNVLATSWSVLDDFALVKGGLLLTDFLGGNIRWIAENGNELGRKSVSQPTSVSLLPGQLLVTERGNGDVRLLANDWQVEAR